MNSDWLADSMRGRVLAWTIYDGPAALANHLWQSTLFALVIALLVLLLRRNSARLRHALWMVASLKFLLPFAALAIVGAQIPPHPAVMRPAAATPPVLAVAGDFTAPLAPIKDHWQLMQLPRTPARSSLLSYATVAPVLALIWALGACIVAGRWLLRWWALRRTLRNARIHPGIAFPAVVRMTAEALEPGIVGVAKPVLLLPAGMEDRLTPAQMRAVLAHELCHLRRRDNLMATLHMLVTTLFWFHPLVWWLGARLIDERERACDEQVVRDGHAPQSYAEAILNVCEHYLAARLPCVSGVSGSDLRKRIESIVKNSLILRLNASKKLLLAALACIAVATPIAAGIVSWRGIEGRSHYRNAMNQYWSVLDAANSGAALCPGRTTALDARQARLAADVAGITAGDGDKALLLAVLANSATDARRLLAEGAARDGDGFLLEDSLLHIAAQFGDPALLQVLLDAGFQVNGMASPLGGSQNPLTSRTPLMVAIAAGRKDNAAWLIQHGADANAVNGAGPSALSYAMATCKDQQLTTQLLQAGAQPNDKARKIATNLNIELRTTPQSHAVVPATPGTAYELAGRQAHDVSAADLRGLLSCPGRSSEVLQAQVPLRETVAKLAADDGEKVLRYAVIANSAKDVRRLLAAGARPADNDHQLLQAAAHFADAPVLQALLDAGYSPNEQYGAAGSALLEAAVIGRTDNVAWLIQHGADVNAGYGNAGSPLIYALNYCRSQALVNLLLRAGARPDASARQIARTYGIELSTGAVALGRGTLDPPRGWESLTPEDLRADTQRGNSPTLYVEARADLDGDGNEDRAALFTAADGSSEGLFVKLSSQHPGQWQLVNKVDHRPASKKLRMGIALKYPGIAFFDFAGAASLVYWDEATRSLKQVSTAE